jgi:hypothetical protein
MHTVDLVRSGSIPDFTIIQVISAFSSLGHRSCLSMIKPSELKLEKIPIFFVSCVNLFMFKPVYLLCMLHKMCTEIHRQTKHRWQAVFITLVRMLVVWPDDDL